MATLSNTQFQLSQQQPLFVLRSLLIPCTLCGALSLSSSLNERVFWEDKITYSDMNLPSIEFVKQTYISFGRQSSITPFLKLKANWFKFSFSILMLHIFYDWWFPFDVTCIIFLIRFCFTVRKLQLYRPIPQNTTGVLS